MVRSAAKNWPHVGVVVDPADYASLLAELARERRRARRRHALPPDAEGVRAHGRLRRRDRELADRARARRRRAGLPAVVPFRRRASCRTLRYGENPHQRAAFYRDEAPAAGHDRDVPAAAGQGAVVQQHRRRRRRVGVREDVRRRPACVIVKHANPCGVARRRDAARRVSRGVRDRPDVGVRRHHRVQPAGRRRHARGGRRAVPRSADRARVHRRRARGDRAQGERPRARGRAARGATRATRSTSSASAAACSCRRPTRATSRRTSFAS